jgi:hypothetical protein
MFSRGDSGKIGWLDLRDEGIGNKDRRGGFLVEWSAGRPKGDGGGPSG